MSGVTPDVIRIDGLPAQGISARDRGLHFGDGLFETIACRHGCPRFLGLHLERLMSGCSRLQIDPGDVATVRNEVETLARGSGSAIVKLIVTRGEAMTRGYVFSGAERATRIMLRYPWSSGSQERARVAVSSMRLGENPALAGLKHLNRLEHVLAQAERAARQFDELLLFGSSGRLVSGTMTNVFIARQGRLMTPRIDACGVAGVMRRVVLREAQRAGIDVEEGDFIAQDLADAEELFLTNARVGIWPVMRLESRELAAGAVTSHLQDLMAPLLEGPPSG